MTAIALPLDDLSPESYVVLGLATCFLKQPEGMQELTIIEPIPAAALGALFAGVPTAYQTAIATTLADWLDLTDWQRPRDWPETAQLCSDFHERLLAAARTYRRDPQTRERLPLGDRYSDFQYSLERKRILNAAPVVRPEDNVKQHAYTHQVL
ncbi:hypothetical protein [Synechococcus elongatus]|uniref:Uncharacterized protein n=2 Tax=Synechococcus elongatus TaxID=32046 RepID=Q31LX5_SYNE7|nr:hypothetical protein [Synechococcus elongatus]ABB57944.1 conserved hypothetical protein [Synechococcus elongatus PCC 7942 = FACHB-805]AJD57576.1 hypothetical protein M744_06855 [Synechococcus elongatus UTEX 2973]MBD2586662.1 hypothetical protein [Synechococcus elongatus FACHB-242]MBD2687736.1 hypothetical protein [Synechococcus elongatus FACHB-1061]MBD2706554.1 hypothetical protein [Synechococcus elongatus PCC 7942 = FACHB-805]